MLSDHLVEQVEANALSLRERWVDRARSHKSIPHLEKIRGPAFTEHIEKMYAHLGEYMEKTHQTEELAQFLLNLVNTAENMIPHRMNYWPCSLLPVIISGNISLKGRPSLRHLIGSS